MFCFTAKKQKGSNNNKANSGSANTNKNGKIKSDASLATKTAPLTNGHNSVQEKGVQKNGDVQPASAVKQNGVHNHNSIGKNGDINDSEDEFIPVKKGKQKNSTTSYAAAAAKNPSPPKTLSNGNFSEIN